MALAAYELVQTDAFRIHDVRCRVGRCDWSPSEEAQAHVVVFVRSGCFVRRARGVETLMDPGVVYFREPGEEQQIAHPTDAGDSCTSVALSPATLAGLWGGDPAGMPHSVFSSPAIDLEHRLLLRACQEDIDAFAIAERLHRVLAAVLSQGGGARVDSARAATAALRGRLVADVRERLAANPSRTLEELARELSVSPHHLSRIFSAATGSTLSRYRNRVRVRHALERLAGGERSLTRLAADLGFADHGHLARVVRAETGSTPSRLRDLLRA